MKLQISVQNCYLKSWCFVQLFSVLFVISNTRMPVKVFLPSSIRNRSSKLQSSKVTSFITLSAAHGALKNRWTLGLLDSIILFWNQTRHKYLYSLASTSPGVQERMQRRETDAFSHVLFTTVIPQPYKRENRGFVFILFIS